MSGAATEAVTIAVDSATSVSGIVLAPAAARACYVFAHGAGAGMHHAFMNTTAHGLAGLGIATLRFQFPSMERGSRRPDSPATAHAAVRAATAHAATRFPGLALVAGGKSFGGRMTSQAQAAAPLPGVRGLAFLGFPLHPADKRSDARAAHLADVQVPMLFVQGTKDALADPALLQAVVERLGERAALQWLALADHSFHVAARSGTTDAAVGTTMLGAFSAWVDAVIRKTGRSADATVDP